MFVMLFTSRLRAAIVSSIIVFGHGTAHAVQTRKSERAHPLAIIFLGNNIANNDIVMMTTKVMITKRNETTILRGLIYIFSQNRLYREYFSL